MSDPQSSFCLLDIMGGAENYDLHHSKSIIAYNAGSIIILWDFTNDTKTNLIEHINDIAGLKFSRNERLLYSVEGASHSAVCVWDWQNGELLQHANIQSPTPINYAEKAFVVESKNGFVISIIECHKNGGYRVSCWDSTSGILNFLYANDLEPSAKCLNAFYASAKGETLVTIEPFCIKIWGITAESVSLIKRIHLSQAVTNGIYCTLTNAFALNSISGSVILISEEVFFSM